MLLDVYPVEVVEDLGHDGTKIIHPNRKGTAKYQGVHIQEILDVCIQHGMILTCIEARPVMINTEGDTHIVLAQPAAEQRFKEYLRGNKAIIIGQGPYTQQAQHAVAWNGERVYDPIGFTYPLYRFSPAEAWIEITRG
jgi:hypothetical protein